MVRRLHILELYKQKGVECLITKRNYFIKSTHTSNRDLLPFHVPCPMQTSAINETNLIFYAKNLNSGR